MTGISAVIITRNEAHNIERCIVSLKGLVDEVIVVDAESTDATHTIAEQAGAQVIIRAWTDYTDQKNFANAKAKSPYILSMDADEAVSPVLRASLLTAISAGLKGAYQVDRLTNYCGTWVRHGGWYPDPKVRLFAKADACWEGTHVHEELRLKNGTPITALKGDLLHYSYPTVQSHADRIERYSELHARKPRDRKTRRSVQTLVRTCGEVHSGLRVPPRIPGWQGRLVHRYAECAGGIVEVHQTRTPP
ncbi:MAG: glycosyltransferase family 2 protein [Flavobacteriales bacterium]|nr:glycosyltransferase family 2 protein [Flavobacteriales bacterium]